MGLRGPLQDPHSVRGERSAAVSSPVAIKEPPKAPKWLKPEERAIFKQLVADAIAAKIEVLPVDTPVYANIARLQLLIENERDPNRSARYMRTQAMFLKAAGLTGEIRARSAKPAAPAEKKSTTAKLLELRRRSG